MPRLLTLAAAVVLALAAPAFATIPTQAPTAREYKLISQFSRAVDEYVLMHRLIEPLPPETMCLPDGTIAKINEIAATPLDGRKRAHEGEIFTADVADLFRDRITRAIRHHDVNVWDLVSDMNEEEIMTPPIVVGESLPRGVGDRAIGWLTTALPALPEGLEYRLAGRDVVLLDTESNVVADVLRVGVAIY
jgi:hypothetical protein